MMEQQDLEQDILRLKNGSKFFFLTIRILFIIFVLKLFLISNLLSKEIKIIADKNNIEELLKLDPNNIDFLFIYAKKKRRIK